MFIGHWAPALAAAAIAPKDKPSRLATLFVAAQLVDWAFFAFLLLGIEHMRIVPGISAMNPMDLYHLPYTHSLLGTLAFASAFGALVYAATRDKSFALIAALVVTSHWLLDLLVHIPDLTLAGSPPRLGLGLWNYPQIEMPLEIGLTLGALFWYARKREPNPLRLTVLTLVLLALQAINWFGPVETSVTAMTSVLAFIGFGVPTALAWWVGKSETRLA